MPANRPGGGRPANPELMWAPDQRLSLLAPLSRQSNQDNGGHANLSADDANGE